MVYREITSYLCGLVYGACVGNMAALSRQAYGVLDLSDRFVVDASYGDVHGPDHQLARPPNHPDSSASAGSNKGLHGAIAMPRSVCATRAHAVSCG